MSDERYILVAEDDPVLKNLLGHTFAGKYHTLYASNGTEALAFVEQYKPSLLLLDLMMPGVDGFAVIEQVRARADSCKDVPIIVFSNLGQQKDRERAKQLGATDYLVKAEVSIEEILAKVEETLAKFPTPAASSAPAVE